MTDRVKGCTITFNRDIRVDDVEHIVNAIKMIKGVQSVDLSIADSSDHMNRSRIAWAIKKKMYDFISDIDKDIEY